MENKWVRLEPLKPSPELREFIRASGAIEAMWEWLPRLPEPGAMFDTYYDYIMMQAKRGTMAPVFAHCKIDGSFAGGANFMRINRTHRNVQIGYMWMPPHLRGTTIALATQAAMIKGAIAWRAKRVYWMVDVLNTRAEHFLEHKIGANKEGQFESHARMNDGRWSTSACYALVGDKLHLALERIERTLEAEYALPDCSLSAIVL